jgi:hypothetical protein
MPKPITTRMHGMLDYPAGILLILAPWIFGFSENETATIIPIVIGALIIGQSLITDYELSLARILPMAAHNGMDVVAGVFLAASPFLFGFSDNSANEWVPHVVAGRGLVLAGLMTQNVPTRDETPARRAVPERGRPKRQQARRQSL